MALSPMVKAEYSSIIITDTSVLINFLCGDRVALLSRLPYNFYITEHAQEEIEKFYPELKASLDIATTTEVIFVHRDDTISELLSIQSVCEVNCHLGLGEISAMNVAVDNNWAFAVDDKVTLSHCAKNHPSVKIFRTSDLIVEMIRQQLITVQEADLIKQDWENKLFFRLKFKSFGDLL
jgi:predicted nucleic acid-binding protein